MSLSTKAGALLQEAREIEGGRCRSTSLHGDGRGTPPAGADLVREVFADPFLDDVDRVGDPYDRHRRIALRCPVQYVLKHVDP